MKFFVDIINYAGNQRSDAAATKYSQSLPCAVTSVRFQRAAPVSPAGSWLAGQ